MNETARQGDEAAFDAMADRLDLIVRFHDREVDAAFVDGLRNNRMVEWLAGAFSGEAARTAADRLDTALADLSYPLDRETADGLAATYADIYLTYGYRISPSSSAWLTEDALDRQEPMFDVRSWFRRHGLEAPSWRTRPDDHIVHELQFVALLLRDGDAQALADAAGFLDDNLLKWLPDFSARMEERVHQPLYVAVAALTLAVVDELRDRLANATGIARPVPEAPQCDRVDGPGPGTEFRYVPGLSESW